MISLLDSNPIFQRFQREIELNAGIGYFMSLSLAAMPLSGQEKMLQAAEPIIPFPTYLGQAFGPIVNTNDITHLNGMIGEAKAQNIISARPYAENIAFQNEQNIADKMGMFGGIEAEKQGSLTESYGLGVVFPWVTQGDESVCEDCADLESGGPYPADDYPEPPHFGCRCNDPFPDPEIPPTPTSFEDLVNLVTSDQQVMDQIMQNISMGQKLSPEQSIIYDKMTLTEVNESLARLEHPEAQDVLWRVGIRPTFTDLGDAYAAMANDYLPGGLENITSLSNFEDVQASFDYYQSSGSTEINGFLKNFEDLPKGPEELQTWLAGDTAPADSEAYVELIKEINNIDDAMNVSWGLEQDITVVRAYSPTAFDDCTVGTVWTDPSFVSTAMTEDGLNTAIDTLNLPMDSWRAEITVPSGTDALPVDFFQYTEDWQAGYFEEVAARQGEAELLLDRNLTFRVDSIDETMHTVKLTVIEAQEAKPELTVAEEVQQYRQDVQTIAETLAKSERGGLLSEEEMSLLSDKVGSPEYKEARDVVKAAQEVLANERYTASYEYAIQQQQTSMLRGAVMDTRGMSMRDFGVGPGKLSDEYLLREFRFSREYSYMIIQQGDWATGPGGNIAFDVEDVAAMMRANIAELQSYDAEGNMYYMRFGTDTPQAMDELGIFGRSELADAMTDDYNWAYKELKDQLLAEGQRMYPDDGVAAHTYMFQELRAQSPGIWEDIAANNPNLDFQTVYRSMWDNVVAEAETHAKDAAAEQLRIEEATKELRAVPGPREVPNLYDSPISDYIEGHASEDSMNSPVYFADKDGTYWYAKAVSYEQSENEQLGKAITDAFNNDKFTSPENIRMQSGEWLQQADPALFDMLGDGETTESAWNAEGNFWVSYAQDAGGDTWESLWGPASEILDPDNPELLQPGIDSIVKDVLINNTDGHMGNYMIETTVDSRGVNEFRLINIDDGLSMGETEGNSMRNFFGDAIIEDAVQNEKLYPGERLSIENWVNETFGSSIQALRDNIDYTQIPEDLRGQVRSYLSELEQMLYDYTEQKALEVGMASL